MSRTAFLQGAGLNGAFFRLRNARAALMRTPREEDFSSSRFNCNVSCARGYRKRPKASRRTRIHTASQVVLESKSITRVEDILKHKFADRSLIAQALAHRSVVNKNPKRRRVVYETENGGLREIKANNERLELLGDRVYGLLVMQGLYNHHAAKSEGQLSVLSHFLLSREQAHKFCEYAYSHCFFGIGEKL